jgi:hypothetical protein
MPDVRPRKLGGAELATTILDSPALVQAVRELEPAVLARLVDTIGLESAGDLVALATTPQLAAVFDEDLWSPAHDDPVERFDARRFGLWLEVMLEAGEAAVVSRLCELPVDFVTLAIHGLVLVVDVDRLGVELDDAGEELDYVEKALDGSLCEEWEEFRLIARDASNWDAVVSALFALDRDHHDVLRGILERCAAMSAEYIADNGGLYEVLTAAETLEADVSAEREERRAARGFVSPADARSFLELARREPTSERDPITRAYFRELVRDVRPKPRERTHAVSAELTRVLEAAGVVTGKPAGLWALTGNVSQTRDVLGVVAELRAALAQLAQEDASLHAERIEELLYVSNVLVAASRGRERQLRPPEAMDAAIATAAFGLDLALRSAGSRGGRAEAAVQAVRATPIERLFAAGFRAIHEAATTGPADRALIDELRAVLEPA